MKSIISLFFSLFLVFTLQAQNEFIIKGQLIDEENETVPYATLSIVADSINGQVIKRLAADDNGKFSFTLSKLGNYNLLANFMSKDELKKEFVVTESSKILDLGRLQMKPASKMLEGVTIVARKPLVRAEIDKLIYDVKEDPEAQTENALDLMRKVPLITVDGEEKIQVKGSGSYKVLINGKPSNMFANDPEKVLKSMPANTIKNIEVITEPGAKYDAEGVSAVINIITEKSATDGYTGSIAAGIRNTGGYNANIYLAMKFGKFGFTTNFSYTDWRRKAGDYSNESNNFQSNVSQKMYGTSKDKGQGQYGNALMSYEFDTLRLLSLSVNRYSETWGDNSKSKSEQWKGGVLDYEYSGYSDSKEDYGGTEVSLDYQRSFSKPNKLLTLSYKVGMEPNDSEGNVYIDMNTIIGNPPFGNPYRTNNDASSWEHTAQIDYVNPFSKSHIMEAGLKFIHRDNSSDGYFYNIIDGVEVDSLEFRDQNQLSHLQNVFAGYGSYQFKTDKFGIKAGLRLENTHQNLNFGISDSAKTNYFDVIPSIIFTRQMGMSQNLKVAYNMNVRRPGIWYLNPYVNRINPQNISMGNPNLDSEKSHNMSLSYSKFSTKLTIDGGVNYSWTDNAITRYTYTQPNDAALYTTYDNIGKNQRLGVYSYINWNMNKVFKFYTNININYLDFKSKIANLHSNGFQSNVFLGGNATLPKDFRINFGGGVYQFGINLQSSSVVTGYYTYISLSKELLDKKMTVSVNVNDPFWATKTRIFKSGDSNYTSHKIYTRNDQAFSLNISYRFGNLKSSVKKAQRGIKNDDVTSSGGGEQQGGNGGGN